MISIVKTLTYLEKQTNQTKPFFLTWHSITRIRTSYRKISSTYLNLGWEERPMKKGTYYNDSEGKYDPWAWFPHGSRHW
jgi:hypothetical protein